MCVSMVTEEQDKKVIGAKKTFAKRVTRTRERERQSIKYTDRKETIMGKKFITWQRQFFTLFIFIFYLIPTTK